MSPGILLNLSALPHTAAVLNMLKTAADLSVTKKEEKNIAAALKRVAPKSETEERVQHLAGRPFTPGQYVRYGTVGTGMGVAGHLAGSAVAGGGRWLPFLRKAEKAELGALEAGIRAVEEKRLRSEMARAVLNPRQLARAGIMGVTFGLGVPTLRRLSDIRAARKGKY